MCWWGGGGGGGRCGGRGVLVGGYGGGFLGDGIMGVQGAVELVGGHSCGCLKEGRREVGFRWCGDGTWLPANSQNCSNWLSMLT